MGKYDTYPKSSGSAGIKGVEYQLSLSMMFLFNALHNLKGIPWRLSTEHKEAGKFDDVILEGPEGDTLLQAKSRENKKKRITLEDLLSINSKNDDFSLPKYFFSYLEIKSKFRIKNLIICTNAEVHEKAKEFLNGHVVPPESLLYFGCDNYLYYTFNENILPQLRENLDKYVDNNSKGKTITREAITDQNLTDFLSKLQFYPNYVPTSNFETHIERLLSLLKSSNHLTLETSFQDVHSKVKEWFEQPKGEYLTEKGANTIFCEINTTKYCDKLEKYNVHFSHNDFQINDTKQIHHVVLHSKSGHLLQVLRIYRALKNDRDKVLYVNSSDGLNKQKQIIESFRRSKYTILVIVSPKITKESTAGEMCKQLKDILDQKRYKKVILLAQSDNVLVKQIKLLCKENFAVFTTSITLDSLAKATQERLLGMENFIFQGNTISTEKLLKPLVDFQKYLNYEVLESLVKNETISVGSKVKALDEHIQRYYITRYFKRKVRGKEVLYSEDDLFSIKEKMILISDFAGMGKSTILTKLATDIKKNHPHLWVIRLNLNDYTRALQNALQTNFDIVNIKELLNSSPETKLRSQFEDSLFSINEKVVLLLDGVDEISPDYTNLIVNLLVHCQTASYFAKIFVTTRPHVIHMLEDNLHVKSFMFEPFSEKNQIDFLTNYWMFSLQLEDKDRNKCEKYAGLLLNELSSWSNIYSKEINYAGIPLLIQMLGEIFVQQNRLPDVPERDGCKEFLTSNIVEPKLPKKINLPKLYEMFVEKKREVFLNRGNPSGNTISNKALSEKFDECLACYEVLAVQIIFGHSVLQYFTSRKYGEENMQILLQVGIVQLFNGEYQFLHKTFTEYFVAKSLARELQNKNATIKFKHFLLKFLINKSSTDENIIVFFNSCLENIVESIPSDFFRNYTSRKYEIDMNTFERSIDIIHNLAEENMIHILKFLLKCLYDGITDKKKFQYKHVLISDFIKTYFEKENEGQTIRGNLFNILRNLLKKGRINIIKSLHYYYFGETPLFCAIQGAHLEMVQFLLDEGASICLKNFEDYTSLMVAAQCGHLNIVEFLLTYIERDSSNLGPTFLNFDINAQNNYGFTALHIASLRRYKSIVNVLLEHGADINVRNEDGNTALHTAASRNDLKILQLLVQKGGDTCIKNKNGDTALHEAVLKSHLDIVNFLLECGTDVNIENEDGNTVLHAAALKSDLEMCMFLVEKGANIHSRNKNGDTVLYETVSKGHLEVVNFLLQQGIDVNNQNENGDTALYNAVSKSDLEICVLLKQRNADVHIRNKTGDSVLHRAASYGYLDIANYLMEIGADLNIRNTYGATALHRAVLNDHVDVVDLLLECGADIDMENSHGDTALQLAASENNLKLVELLVQCSADVNKGRDTALRRCAEKGHTRVIKILLESGANVNIRNAIGDTALHSASKNGHLDIVRILLESGADVNIQTAFGDTALHEAAGNDHADVVNMLLESGADVNVQNVSGDTALGYSGFFKFKSFFSALW